MNKVSVGETYDWSTNTFLSILRPCMKRHTYPTITLKGNFEIFRFSNFHHFFRGRSRPAIFSYFGYFCFEWSYFTQYSRYRFDLKNKIESVVSRLSN